MRLNILFRKWTLFAAAACAALLILAPASASAHAYVVSSQPAANETLDTSPATFEIEFNEPIEAGFHKLEVIGPNGNIVNDGGAGIDPRQPSRLTASLQPNLPEGLYTAKWNVVSGDGHAISGTIPFQIGRGDTNNGLPIHPTTDSGNSFPGWSLVLVRWLFYGGMAGYLGTVVFHAWLLPRLDNAWPERLKRRSRAVLLAGLIAASAGILLSLPQQTANDAGGGWREAFDPELWRQTLVYTTFGEIWKIQLLLLGGWLLWTVFLLRTSRITRPRLLSLAGGLVFGLGLLLSKAFIGHAATAELPGLAITMDFLHLAASLIWLGGVGALAFLLPVATLPAAEDKAHPSGTPQLPLTWRTVRRFSLLAFLMVAILMVSGVYGSLLHVPTLYSFTHTAYGRVLILKIALTLICLLLGAWSFLRGRRAGKPLSAAGVWTEFGTGLVVLVLAAVLANLPTASASPGPATLTKQLDDGTTVMIRIAPNALGTNTFQVSVDGPEGHPRTDVEQVTLQLTSKEMDMGTTEIIFPGSSPTEVRELITMGGRWNVHVHILTKSLNSYDYDTELSVGTP
ncbi:copper resistance CopC/CopD family protein [Paenibacillus rubinfantis]|uniref:copper resistance CopC/CopD family protein n=1 Tax=Paenibacillus rubinfantis TaxID=1720296 RepID=UPI00073EF43C|nr:copper resistance CopC/CopD family protein [Paenibacillus rubinfantis]